MHSFTYFFFFCSLCLRLSLWVKGHAYLHGRDYTSAINAFRQLEETSVLSRNVDILATLGETYYLAGDAKNALSMLQRVSKICFVRI